MALHGRHFIQEDLACSLEGQLRFRTDGRGRGEILLQVVNLLTVLPEAEADVGARSKSGAAHVADDIPLSDCLALFDVATAHVQILCGIGVVVADLHILAVALGIAGVGDDSIPDSDDFRSVGSGIVGSEVGLDLLQNGVCLLYTSPSPRDLSTSRMPSSA